MNEVLVIFNHYCSYEFHNELLNLIRQAKTSLIYIDVTLSENNEHNVKK